MATKTTRNPAGSGNRALAVAMQELRRSNAATRHLDRHAEARKGTGKGGRGATRRAAITEET